MDTDRGDGHVKGENGREVMWPWATERHGWLEPPEAGRDSEGPAPGDHGPAHTSILDVWPSGPQEGTFLLF